MEDLLNEAIHVRGYDCQYIFRDSDAQEIPLLGEDPASKFDDVYTLEAFVENLESFDGAGDILNKFGIWGHNYGSITLTARQWRSMIPSHRGDRPREGDLIYVDVFNMMFEITKVDNQVHFYTFGRKNRTEDPYAWRLTVEQFRYSNESINTGDNMIDAMEVDMSVYRVNIQLRDGSGDFIITEDVSTSDANSAVVADWNPANSVLSLVHPIGTFNANTTITGSASGAEWIIGDLDLYGDKPPYDSRDNREIQDEADLYIINNESNPITDE